MQTYLTTCYGAGKRAPSFETSRHPVEVITDRVDAASLSIVETELYEAATKRALN